MNTVEINSRPLPVIFRRNLRAKSYILRLDADQTVMVTVPRHGTMEFARNFVLRRRPWLEKRSRNLAARKILPAVWTDGTEILFRGQPVILRVEVFGEKRWLCFATERAPLSLLDSNLRSSAERHLRQLALNELPARVRELAALHQLAVKKISVRNQKRRWGSCTRDGAISLNWRLIQAPPAVRDYIVLHELMHLRELNHSPNFWAAVENVCPSYRDAERWIKLNASQLGF